LIFLGKFGTHPKNKRNENKKEKKKKSSLIRKFVDYRCKPFFF
jgi:hypothetical protein